ncbi:MDM20 [Candida oxycetoniae]|uniref:MDM20 n=1 Tax=Candida oxycetoniae TaxID=497107 RepID=A0AAI9SYQ8_9ASCO|nr:MDM20 [Candida oxycetoniae]KAI3405374.2 MDM20 [Candida oxycetoniae]
MVSDSDYEIIELIDRGQYSYAQSLLLQKIKKFSQRIFYRVLQNRILYDTGSQKQAIDNNLQLLQKCSNEIDTVTSLNEFFQSISMQKEANLCYESVIKKYPIQAEELSLIWFENSIQQLDVAHFNKVFSYLNKSNKSETKYCYWYAFSFYLMISQQSKEEEKGEKGEKGEKSEGEKGEKGEGEKGEKGEGEKGEKGEGEKQSKLKLYKMFGKKLIEELQKSHPFANCQELYVYTRFLLLNEDYRTIEDTLGKFNHPLDLELRLLYLDSMKRNKSWKTLYEYTTRLLFEENFDDFDTWILWLNSGKQVGESREALSSRLATNTTTTTTSRNELLVKIELANLFNHDTAGEIDTYYEKFKNKLSCYSDLSRYDLSGKFEEKVSSVSKEILNLKSRDVEHVITLVNNQKFNPIVDNWDIYKQFSSASVRSKSEFDNNPLNELALISIVTDLSRVTPSTKYATIIKNIAILVELLKSDKYNYRLNLWLMKLYAQLNTNDMISSIYKALKINMVQHETLGYYYTSVSPPTKATLDDLINIFRFYLTSKHEIKETIQNGFEKGVYSKLQSFITFGQKLQNSISLNSVVQKIIQTILIMDDTQYLHYFIKYLKENRKSILFGDWSDNRDLKSEWSSLLVTDELKTAQTNKIMQIPIDDTCTKLKLLVYSMFFEHDESEILRLLKIFNKILSSPDFKPDQFTSFIFKSYYNIIKLTTTKINKNESQSLYNSLQKSLKFGKIESMLTSNEEILSHQLNTNLMNLVELIKLVKSIAKRSPSAYLNEIINTTKSISNNLKKNSLISKQLDIIDEMKFVDLPLELDTNAVIKEIKESITSSTKSILNHL